jgi:hypothetical protein
MIARGMKTTYDNVDSRVICIRVHTAEYFKMLTTAFYIIPYLIDTRSAKESSLASPKS